MSPDDLDAALDDMRRYAGLSHQDVEYSTPSRGEAFEHARERRTLAEELVSIAARFAEAFAQNGGGDELRRRTVYLETLTGPGSQYDMRREVAYKRMLQEFRRACPKRRRRILTVAQLTVADDSEPDAKYRVDWQDVDYCLGVSESILWCPFELKRYSAFLTVFLNYPELEAFDCELRIVAERMAKNQLWGSFLIAASYEAGSFKSANSGRYGNLVSAIAYRQGAVGAIKGAAEDLRATLEVDPKTLPDEFQDILMAMLEMGATSESKLKTTAEIAEAVVGSSVDAEKFKVKMAKLGHRRLVGSKRYRGGGCWLTSLGRSAAEKLTKR